MADKPEAIHIKTSAIALYDILATIKDSPSPRTIMEAWERCLNASRYSEEFTKRHAEVTSLLLDLQNEIASLESERLRKRLGKYSGPWWTAIVHPQRNWEQSPASELILSGDLDMLGAACDLLGSQIDESESVAGRSDLARLRAECDAWLALVADNDEIADGSFRQVLLAQINHLIWLIDNADTFGIARVIQQGDQVTGTLVRTVRQKTVRYTPRFRDRINGFIAALTLVANLIHSSQVIFDAADHALPDTEKIIKELTSGSSNDAGTIEDDGTHRGLIISLVDVDKT